MALRSNTKKARENIRNYVLYHAADYLEENYNIRADILERDLYRLINRIFESEMLDHNSMWKKGRGSRFEFFRDWAAGLAMGGLFCYYYNRSAVNDLGEILEESDAEKARFTESDAEEMLTRLIYRDMMKEAFT